MIWPAVNPLRHSSGRLRGKPDAAGWERVQDSAVSGGSQRYIPGDRVTAERRRTLMKGSDEVPEKVRVTHGREGARRAGARSFWLNSPGKEARVAHGWSGLLGGAGESPGVALGQMETEMVA